MTPTPSPRLRRIPPHGLRPPPGSTWALLRGALHAAAPDPSSPGPVRGLEREAAFHLQAAHAVALGGATAGLDLLLAALALPAGTKAFLSALSAPWLLHGLRAADLEPVLLDVDPGTLQPDPALLRETPMPRGSLLVARHLAGVPCDLDALGALCRERGLSLVEDFGTAVGARWRERPVGGFGACGLAALGEAPALGGWGGALLLCDDDEIARRLRDGAALLPEPDSRHSAGRIALGQARRLLSWPAIFGLLPEAAWQQRSALERHLLGGPERRTGGLHPAQAEATRSAFFALEAALGQQRERAAHLRWGLPRGCWRQVVPEGALPAWSALLVRARDPDACAAAARARGVVLGSGVLRDLSEGTCPAAAEAARACVALPCHPGLAQRDLDRVLEAVADQLG